MKKVKKKQLNAIAPTEYRTIVLQVTNLSHYQLSYRSLLTIRKISKDYGQILVDNKILVSILTHRCQCPHGIPKTGGVRGGATHVHKRKLSSEPHVKKGYKLGNHLFHNSAMTKNRAAAQGKFSYGVDRPPLSWLWQSGQGPEPE